jgi:hypothetical protein
MPAELAVDWVAVQATYAATNGNAELTAKAHGIESAAVRQRAHRGEWKGALSAVLSAVGMVQHPKPVTAVTVIDPVTALSQAVTEQQQDYRKRGNFAVTKASARAAEKLADSDPDEILERVPELVGLAKAIATANPDQQQPSTVFNLAFIQQTG